MSKEQRYGAYIGIMIGLLIALMLLLSGCVTHSYGIETGDTSVLIESRLEFKQVKADYIRTDDTVEFHFWGSEVTATPLLDQSTLDAIQIISDKLP